MSPVILTVCLFTFITVITHLVNLFIKKRNNKTEALFLHLSKEGSANNLVFCSQEILGDKVMGIDGIHRKVMILEKIDRKYKASIWCLDEVKSCELKKSFSLSKNLNKIELQFGFKNNSTPASVTFYDQFVNSKREIVLLKAKAEYWKIMLSKMLVYRTEVTV
jgi:hypothetical protein